MQQALFLMYNVPRVYSCGCGAILHLRTRKQEARGFGLRIAVDVHGGDHAPQAVIEGVCRALDALSGQMQVVLVGEQGVIEAHLARMRDTTTRWDDCLTIRHASQVIDAEDEPVRAVQQKKNASLVIAAKMVREGHVDAMVTAGNTGAFLVAGTLLVGRLKGIERPALAPLLPTRDGRGVMVLDAGANMDATENHLYQYAHMASLYRQKVHGIEMPRVGLLNIGTEATKGNKLTKATYPLLQQSGLHFVGNVEARDVLGGVCDVLVCDGFSGNILLKSLEGSVSLMFHMIKEQLRSSWWTTLAGTVVRSRLRTLRSQFDEKQVAIAPMLGVNGVLLKCHGSSDAPTFCNALMQIKTVVESNMNTHIGAIAWQDEADSS